MTWDDIKNLPAEINGKNKHSTNDPDKIYNNEEIMIMFIYKLNDRYRFSRIVDMGVQGDMDRLFLEGYIDNKNYVYLPENINNIASHCIWWIKYDDDTFGERLVLPINKNRSSYII